jgi:hypothetical protein
VPENNEVRRKTSGAPSSNRKVEAAHESRITRFSGVTLVRKVGDQNFPAVGLSLIISVRAGMYADYCDDMHDYGYL